MIGRDNISDMQKTDVLIEDLVQSVQAVPQHRVSLRLSSALAFGLVTAIALQMMTVGLRPDAASAFGYVVAKISVLGVAALLWWQVLRRRASPGQIVGAQGFLALTVLAVTVIIAFFAPYDLGRLQGCLSQVLFLASPALIAFLLALRFCAPTKLSEAGFAAGIAAGAIGAIGYSLGCTADDAAVVCFRYGLSILACGLIGLIAGRGLLRW